MEGLRSIKREVKAFRVFVTSIVKSRRRWSAWTYYRSEQPSPEDSLGTSGLVRWLLIIIVAISEPTVASLVLDIEIAIFNYD